MANRECPTCHSRTEFAAKCPYCPNCGWNRDAAIKSVRRGLVIIPVGLLGFLGSLAAVYFASAAQMRGGATPSFVIPFLCIIPVIYLVAYFFLRKKLEELNALPERR
jgi:hypothetical protein